MAICVVCSFQNQGKVICAGHLCLRTDQETLWSLPARSMMLIASVLSAGGKRSLSWDRPRIAFGGLRSAQAASVELMSMKSGNKRLVSARLAVSVAQSPRSVPGEMGRADSLRGPVCCFATRKSTENSRSVYRHRCAPSSNGAGDKPHGCSGQSFGNSGASRQYTRHREAKE